MAESILADFQAWQRANRAELLSLWAGLLPEIWSFFDFDFDSFCLEVFIETLQNP